MVEYMFSLIKCVVSKEYNQLKIPPENADEYQEFGSEEINEIMNFNTTADHSTEIINHLKKYCQSIIIDDGNVRVVRGLMRPERKKIFSSIKK